MNDSGGRWWETRAAGQPNEDEGGYRDLVTDTRGRSRPERSLSVGVDPANEPHHPSRVVLWTIASIVAAAALILVVGYALPKDESSSASADTTSPVAVAPGSTHGDAEGEPPRLPAPLGNPPAAGNAPPVVGTPGGLGGNPGGAVGSQGGGYSSQPGRAPSSRLSLPPPAQPTGPAPADNPPPANPAPANNPAPPKPAPANPAPANNPAPAPPEAKRDRLLPNEQLDAGQRLVSPNGRFLLIMQKDGNLVEYEDGNRAVWASGTSTPQSIVRMQDDGNVVVIAPGNRPVWATSTDGNRNATLELQDDGNVVVYAQGHRAVWSTGIP